MFMNLKYSQRIGLVLPNIPTYSETFFNSKIKGLQENGYEVVLFSKSSKKNQYSSYKIVTAPNFAVRPYLIIEILLIFWTCLIYFKKASKLYELNRNEGKSFLKSIKNIFINSYFFSHSLEWLHFGFGTMALQSEHIAEVIGAKMAVSFRGFDFYVYPIKNPNCYNLLFSKKVRYHVLSDKMRTLLIQRGVSAKDIFKITPAIDVKLFNFQENTSRQFITISRLHWIKGLEYTLEAFYLLKNQGIPFHYTIIGEGIEREKLTFLVNQLGLNENVTFAGSIPYLQVKNQLEKGGIYIQYSLQEGFCNAVLEAQAMGLLCIVSDADGLVENVIDQETGWVIPKRNAILLAQKMADVLQLEETKAQMIKKNAMERVKNEFNLEKQNALFLSFYSN